MTLYSFRFASIKSLRRAWTNNQPFYGDGDEGPKVYRRNELPAGTPVKLVSVRENVEIKLPTKKRGPLVVNQKIVLNTVA